MKKKTCEWLDSNVRGGLNILDDKIYPCCGPSKPLYDEENLDYTKISLDELQQKRKKLQDLINEGKACQGCERIIEKEEDEINVGPVSYLSIGLFDTCNLRCKYCYFSHEQLGAKLKPERTKVLPLVQKFAEGNLLKDDIGLGLAGGEPSLFEDLPETLNYLAEKYATPDVSFISNASIKNKAESLAKKFPYVNKKILKRLYTSIDAGTSETYKNVRGQDLYFTTCNNVINYAKTDSFEEIILKYIFLFDHSNTSDKDVFGFLNLARIVQKHQKGKTIITIDYDMCANKIMDDEMIAAAGKLYYGAKLLGIDIVYCGGALAPGNIAGKEAIDKLEQFAQTYEYKEKNEQEMYYLEEFSSNIKLSNIDDINAIKMELLEVQEELKNKINDLNNKTDNMLAVINELNEKSEQNSFLEQIFSVKNDDNWHKVITILGIKMKFNMKES
ncbi:MAG: radical SAM protein [Candidatus Gastranaerophilales bacterium]|nr:radical SAM protein [Candidatus Gastranaerophilales bacterium]